MVRWLSHTGFGDEMNQRNVKRGELQRKLEKLNETFEREMLERGFDPDQVENVPLNNKLAKLHAERLELIEQLDNFAETEGTTDDE